VTGRPVRDVVLVHGLADQEPVWSAVRHARGTVHHTRTIGARWLAFVTWDGTWETEVLDDALARTVRSAAG
jgi:hypothetical protein